MQTTSSNPTWLTLKWIRSHFNPALLTSIGLIIALRLVIYSWLHHSGYFYGIPWDSFSRTLISYNWSKQPFFSLSDGYWLPFQFWLVGTVYAIINPWYPTSDILVPILINNIFFLGSLTIIYKFVYRSINNAWFALFAALIVGIFAGDIFVSYTALSEPILIFFILLASYQFYKMVVANTEDLRINTELKASIAVFLASATHYIGWFLAIFFISMLGIYFLKLRPKSRSLVIKYLIAIILCVLMPTVWLVNNYLIWGNFLHPLKFAADMQSNYIGQLSPIARLLVTPKVMFQQFYSIVIPGILAILIVIIKRPKALIFAIPTLFVLSIIILSTLFAMSAPYQEPRYLVFASWTLIPYLVIAGYDLWLKKSTWIKSILVIVLVFIVFVNIRSITKFQNSFGFDVQTVSMFASEWFDNHDLSARIILNQDSFAESGVITVMSGHPDRIIHITNEGLNAGLENPRQFLDTKANLWMCITKNPSFADHAKEQGLVVNREGAYFLIYPP